MARAKPIITPVGVFKYCHLNKPDERGAAKFGGEPKYKVTLVLPKDDPEAIALMKTLDEKLEEAMEAGAETMEEATAKQKNAWKKAGVKGPVSNAPYQDEYDEDDEPTGNVTFSFKTGTYYKDRDGKKQSKTVMMIDGKGVTIPTNKRPLVYGGTVGRVAFATSSLFIAKGADVYVGMYLNQVQIVELQSSGGSSAFGAVEGSDFDADDLEEYESKAKDEDKADDDDLDDDLDDIDDDEIPF